MQAKPNYRVKAEIIRKGYLLQDFAKKAGINNKTLSRVINGWEIPTLTIERKIAKALRIKREKLFKK